LDGFFSKDFSEIFGRCLFNIDKGATFIISILAEAEFIKLVSEDEDRHFTVLKRLVER